MPAGLWECQTFGTLEEVSYLSLMGLAGVLECCGGLLLVLGLFTRPVAIVLLLEMLYAFSTVHLPKGGAPIQNGGELALLYGLISPSWPATAPVRRASTRAEAANGRSQSSSSHCSDCRS